VSEFDSSHSLALLPNYAFALPMARFRLEQAQEQQQQGAAASSSGSSAGVSSLTLLAQALLLHPLVLVELVGKLQGQGAAREEAWQQLKQRKLYAKVGCRTNCDWNRIELSRRCYRAYIQPRCKGPLVGRKWPDDNGTFSHAAKDPW